MKNDNLSPTWWKDACTQLSYKDSVLKDIIYINAI